MKNVYIILLTIISLNLFAQNEIEPNNSFSNANQIALSTNWQGYINVSNDQDYYKFNISEPGILKLVVISVPSDVFLRGHFYSPEMVEIRKETSSLGQGYQMEVSTCAIGEHFLLLYNASSANNSSTEPYLFRVEFTPFSEVDVCECENNAFNNACLINTDEPIDALIAPWFDDDPLQEDNDYYKFNITEPGILKLVVTSVPSDVFLRARFYNPDLTEIREETSSLGQGYQMEVSTCDIGEHILLLYNASSANNFNSEEQYSFRIDFTPFSEVDACECENNSFNNSCLINAGVTIDALITPWFDDEDPFQEDNDYYRIDIQDPGILKLVITSVPSDVFLRARFYNPDLNEIREETSSLGQGYQMEVSTCDIGEHILLLYNASSANNFNSEEQYSFRVEFTPFSDVDGCECENNSFNNACLIDTDVTIDALIAPWFDDDPFTEDDDYYKFNIPEPGVIKLIVTSVPSDVFLRSHIYNPTMEEIIKETSALGQGFQLELSTCEEGEYFLLLYNASSANNYNSEEQYSFRIEFTPFSVVDGCECNSSFDDACQIDFCDPVLATIAPSFYNNSADEDTDMYEVEVSSIEEVGVEITSVPSNIRICVRIYDSAQIQIDNFNGNPGQALNFNFSTPDDGVYYIEVQDCNGNYNIESQYEIAVGCNLVNSTQDYNLNEIADVYPNPFSESFNIKFNTSAGHENEINIYDILGNLVFSSQNITADNLLINTESLPNGIYVLRLKTKNKYYSTKLLKN